MKRRPEQGVKKASCVNLDSTVKFYGFILAKMKNLSFSEYLEELIIADCLKHINDIDKEKGCDD